MTKHIFSFALVVFLISACSSKPPINDDPLQVPTTESVIVTPTPFPTPINNSTEVAEEVSFYIENGIIFGYDEIGDYSENGLARVKVNEKYGYIDKLGNIVIEPIWEDAYYEFNGDFTFVKKDSKWTVINTEGKIISDVQWDDYSILSKRFALVKKDNKYFSIDSRGVVISEFQWDDVSYTNFGELLLVKENGKHGLIDVFGNIFTDMQWDEIPEHQYNSYKNGFIAVKKDGKWGLLDLTGKIAITPEWDEVNVCDSTMILVCKNGLWGYINNLNEVIIEPIWDSEFYFYNDMITEVSKNGKYGCIDKNGNIIIEPKWDYARFPGLSNLLCVSNDDDTTQKLIDMKGKVIFELEKDCWIEGVVEDLLVLNCGYTQTINIKTGEKLLEENRWWGMCSDGFFFYGGSPFIDGGLRILQDMKNNNIYGYIDSTGRLVSEEEYDENGKLLYEIKYDLNGKKEVIDKIGEDKTGEQSSEQEWVRVDDADNDFIIIFKDGKYGIINREDKIVLEPIYNNIQLLETGIYVVNKNGKKGILNLLN